MERSDGICRLDRIREIFQSVSNTSHSEKGKKLFLEYSKVITMFDTRPRGIQETTDAI